MFGERDKKQATKGTTPKESAPGKGTTLIAANTRVEGDIHFSDQILVNGEIRGNVFADTESDAGLTVSAKGSVAGEIRVPNVVVNGRVQGDIHASRHVELAAEARVEGNVYYNLIEMVMGARVDGSLVYTPSEGQVADEKPLRQVTADSDKTKSQAGDEAEQVAHGKPTAAVGNSRS